MKSVLIIFSLVIFYNSCFHRNLSTEGISNLNTTASFKKENETHLFNQNLNETIPEILIKYVKIAIPNYHIPDLSDFDKAWNLFYEDSLSIPYYIAGDFNGDGLTDYALLLMNNEKELFLGAFHRVNDVEFKFILIEDIGNFINKIINVGLYVQKTGEIEGIGGRLILFYDAIILSIFEKSSKIYYWDKDNYTAFPLGD